MASPINLLPEEGRFYKANLHSHTTVSDGRLTPVQMKEQYKERGYSVLCLSDHNKLIRHPELNDPDFLMLDGFEFDITESKKSNFIELKTTHINFIDTDPAKKTAEKEAVTQNYPAYGDIAALNAYIARMNELGFISFYNHPHWSLETLLDIKDMQGFWGFEIYNHGCEISGMNGYAGALYNDLLRRGQNLFCVMTDDNHNFADINSPNYDSFGGFTMIKAQNLTYKSIINALRTGDFYCSTGPLIHSLRVVDDFIHIKCDSVAAIFLLTDTRRSDCLIAPDGEVITGASFSLPKDVGHFRIVCKGTDGKTAETNPYYIKNIL